MSVSLSTYALMKTLYDKNRQYIDCFCPFVLQVMSPEKQWKLSSIQDGLKNYFDVGFPIHAIEAILKRLVKRKYVEKVKGKKKYYITEAGKDFVETLESRRDADRRIESFISSLVHYFATQEVNITADDAMSMLKDFVDNNRFAVMEFIGTDIKTPSPQFKIADSNVRILIDFMMEVDDSRPDDYNTMRDLILGSLISTTVFSRTLDEFDSKNTKKLKGFTVYLDTNIIFSILKLHEKEQSLAANELIKLLRDFQFDIRVLNSTIDELCRVIKRYRSEIYKYPEGIRVDTIYSTLRRKGWYLSDAKDFILNIEDTLNSHGITIETELNIDLKNYTPKGSATTEVLSRYKPYQDLNGQMHDLSAIEAVETLRGRPERKFEDARFAFVSSDGRLSRFNWVEMGHKKDNTICEVFLDRILNNILWLHNPNLDLPLSAIIATHSRELFISRAVWSRFHDVIQGMVNRDEVSEKDVALLFYHNRIEEVLMDIDDTSLSDINPTLILQHIQEQANELDTNAEKRVKEAIAAKEKAFINSLDTAVSNAQAQTEDDFYEKFAILNNNLRASSFSLGKWICLIIRIVIVACIAITGALIVAIGGTDAFTWFNSLLGLAIVLIGLLVGFDVSSLGKKCRRLIGGRIYKQRKNELLKNVDVTIGD